MMVGKLKPKFKVIHSIISKDALKSRRNTKPKRDSTPQRWSRRIRSLPPIPFDVLKPSRKVKTIKTEPRKRKIEEVKSSKSRRKNHLGGKYLMGKSFFQKRPCIDDCDSLEIIRIIPVVVCVKRNKTKLRSLSDHLQARAAESKMNLAGSKCQTFETKLREECLDLEKKWSERLKTLPYFPRWK